MFTYFVVAAIYAIFNVPFNGISTDIEHLCLVLCVINDLNLISRAVNSGK